MAQAPRDPKIRSMRFEDHLSDTDTLMLELESDATLRWNVAQGIEMGRPSRLRITAERRGGEVAEVRVSGNAVVACRGQINIP